MKLRVSSNTIGADFEQKVYDVLRALAQKFPQRVYVERHTFLLLQNGEEVIPDIDLLVVLPHERQFYFVECQAREGYSKDILHKIRHIRSKSWRQTFLFVYPESIPGELCRALEVENILHFSLAEFSVYIDKLSHVLEGLSLRGSQGESDPGSIVELYRALKSSVPLSVAFGAIENFDELVEDMVRLAPDYGQKERGSRLGGG